MQKLMEPEKGIYSLRILRIQVLSTQNPNRYESGIQLPGVNEKTAHIINQILLQKKYQYKSTPKKSV